jgi:alpha-glucosidase
MDADWWRGAVIYQIYPLSFRDSDGDGLGDLKGVTERLPYVASLGVDGIWLSPFFTSPLKDFGYDVSDYTAVDPRFGTLADFDALVARAHDLGLKVVIDQVWNHTSDQHAWFKESALSRESAKADWYVWADPKRDGTPPNNWMAAFGGPSWTWSARRRQYFYHHFLPEQPDLNYWNADVRAAIIAAGRFWLERGVDGFRLDVVNYYFHDPALADNPALEWRETPAWTYAFQRHLHDRSRPETLAFMGEIRALLDSFPDRMSVGEIGDEHALERQRQYTEGNNRLHTAYSFHLLSDLPATPARIERGLDAWNGSDGWPAWSLGNHDVARYPTRLAHDDPAHVRALMVALVCLRGTIFLFQGEELGLPQAEVPFERLRDPFAINNYAGSAFRDGARTPMPWSAKGPNAGFSAAAETWLPLDERHRALAADVQEADPASMLHAARRIIALRKAHPALQTGEVGVVKASEGVLALARTHGDEALLCLVELGGKPARFELPANAKLVFSLSGDERVADGAAELPAYGAAILSL